MTPYLIQRLQSPFRFKSHKGTDVPFGIGQTPGIEPRKLIKSFCEFDYMGSRS